MKKSNEAERVKTPFAESHRQAKLKSMGRDLTTLIWFLNSNLTRTEHKDLRKEIARDITPVIKMAGDHEALLRMRPVYDLIQKINGLNVRFKWFFWLVPAMPGGSGNIKPGSKFLKFPDGFSYGGYKKCLVYKWIDYGDELGPHGIVMGGNQFLHWFEHGNINALRKASYGTIINSLEDGTFSKIKICKECQIFFIAKRLSDKFCSQKCSEAYFARDAKNRVRRSRDTKRQREERRAKMTEERRCFNRFSTFMHLAGKTRHSEEELPKINPILKALGKGERLKGWKRVNALQKKSPKEAWANLSEKEKDFFQS